MLFLVFILSYIAYSDITKRKIYNKSIVFLLFITLWLNFIFRGLGVLNYLVISFSLFVFIFHYF